MPQTCLALVANAGDGTVTTFRLDGGSGQLTRLATSDVGPRVSTFAVDAERDLVHAGVKSPPAVVTLRLDRGTGALTPAARRELEDAPTYLALTPDTSLLLVASYHAGLGTVCRVDRQGRVSSPVSRVQHPNLHSVAVSADGRFAYFVSLGADLVAQYTLGSDGSLTPLEPPTVPAPRGSGPRHIVLDEPRDAAYVMTEFSGEVLAFGRDRRAGQLWAGERRRADDPALGLPHSRFGADPTAEQFLWGADLHLAPDGRHLWCSERTGSTLATLPIDRDGRLGDPTAFVRTEPQPRGFAVSPDGGYLLAAGERSTHVALYRIEPDGRLQLLSRHETGTGANWIRFAG